MHGLMRLADFIAGLPESDLDTLYGDTGAVIFVYRHLLPPLAQQFVIRLLFCGARPFPESVLQKWTTPESNEALTAASTALRRFRVFIPSGGRTPDQLLLNKLFQKQLSAHLLGQPPLPTSITTLSRGMRPPAPGSAPSAEELYRCAVSRWDAVLMYLTAGKVVEGQGPGVEVEGAFCRLGLQESGRLTASGFRFVLDSRREQIWTLVLALLERSKANKQHMGPLLMALSLSEAKVGQRLEHNPSSPPEQHFVDLLTSVGVLCRKRAVNGSTTGAMHWATPAAVAMFRDDANAALSRSFTCAVGDLGLPGHLYHETCKKAGGETENPVLQEEQGIVVESNFKVYAYTSSSLHVRLLGLFCRMVMRLPNLVVGHISAEEVLQAMKRGIQAENIVRYLEGAAHPRALKRLEDNGSVVPANVRSQLEVWESNRARTSTWRAVCFEWDESEFDQASFEAARQHAASNGSLLWAGSICNRGGAALTAGAGFWPHALVVRAEGAPSLRAFFAKAGRSSERDSKRIPPPAAPAREVNRIGGVVVV